MTLVETGDNRAIQQRNLVAPWKPGQSGNPLGRPQGSRNKLAEQFFVDVYEDWTKHGPEALVQVRQLDPSTYLKLVAQVLPKELVVKQESIDDLSDEELLDIIATLRHLTAENRVIEGLATVSSEGREEPPRVKSD